MSPASRRSPVGAGPPSPWRPRLHRLGTIARRFLGYGLSAVALAAGLLYLDKLEAQPDLSPWHTVDLEEEFHAGRVGEVQDLASYLRLEDRLFAELDRKVYAASSAQGVFSRYRRGSRSDPQAFERNWNRTFELEPEGPPRAGLLLLHGMSDSPYSLRALGQAAAARGARVLGLRLPGHGTAPAGMAEATWRDMAAAVRIGMRHLRAELPGAPLHILGYSNGGALAVEYALDSITDDELPRVSRLVLVAPSIGVRPLASLARWQARLARWLDADKAAWTSVLPEVDPFKYTSFAVNGGAQVHALTRRIGRQTRALADDDGIPGFPPVLAFVSEVDATVDPAAVVSGLFLRLAREGHELVLFDVNFMAESQALLTPGSAGRAAQLRQRTDLPFDLTIVSNEPTGTFEVVAWRRPAGADRGESLPLGLAWPADVYALSHISTPFPPDDPVYGNAAPADDDHVFLGRLEVLGERGVLSLPATWLVRLRHNPFYGYVERRALDWMGLTEKGPETARTTRDPVTSHAR